MMFSLKYIRSKSGLWRNALIGSRLKSTRMCAQKTQSQEFCLENYDCIGFDLDHTICNYNLKPLFNLIYKTLASFMIERYDYPQKLLQLHESDLAFAQKGIVLDKSRGNFLKLDSQYRIRKASHGTRFMSKTEIQDIYGVEQMWEDLSGIPHKLTASGALQESFYVFKDFFVTPGAIICAKMINVLDERGRVSTYSFWDQYIEGVFHMYERSNFRNNCGQFFPSLKSDKALYLRECSPNVKAWLRELCQHKMTFLLTSSNYDSAEFLAQYALGKEWKEYFDVIVTFARKPGFFWKERAFCRVDDDHTETQLGNLQEIRANAVYSQGNFKDLMEVCARRCDVESPKTLYFGDSLIEDVYAASSIGGCDTVAIVEEMSDGLDDNNAWGSFFRIDGDGPSLWSHLLSRHTKITVPNLDSVCQIKLQDKIPCFDGSSVTSGYFPRTPKSLL